MKNVCSPTPVWMKCISNHPALQGLSRSLDATRETHPENAAQAHDLKKSLLVSMSLFKIQIQRSVIYDTGEMEASLDDKNKSLLPPYANGLSAFGTFNNTKGISLGNLNRSGYIRGREHIHISV